MRRWMALILCLCFLGGCRMQTQKTSQTAFYFDTAVTVTLYGGEAEWIKEAFDLCAEYEQIFSRTLPDSELYRLNETGHMAVSGHLGAVIDKSLDYSRLSDGKFDVTTSAYLNLWDFTGAHPTPPDAAALQAAKEKVGYEKIFVDGDTVTLLNGATIDLGGIAKGYIADRLAEFFEAKGANAVISLGGNIYLTGAKPDGAPYSVGIKDPDNTADLAATLRLPGGYSVVTSGDYERCFERNGVRYHHILDATSGMPAHSDLRSATVIASSSADADALSTVCFLLGRSAATDLIEGMENVEAVIIGADGQITCTSGIGAGKGVEIEYS